MEKERTLLNVNSDIKQRINYLVYKDKLRKENVTTEDLKKAYEYSNMNIKVMEEAGISMIELVLLEEYQSRICDMYIVQLYHRLFGFDESVQRVKKIHQTMQMC